MEREVFIQQEIKKQGVLPLFYHDDLTVCTAVTKALYAAGIRCIEFTNRGTKALANFSALLKERKASWPDLLLGIGTIKTADDAEKFVKAGADFLISPIFDAAVCDVAYLHKVLWIPGCMTVTEIHVAQQAGCKLVKLFPGNVLQPAFAEAIMPLFNGIDFVVTGGVDATEQSISSWFKAGVTGVGLGSKLISKTILEQADYPALQKNTEDVLTIIQKIRKQ
ncbi:MAG: bifunctional 4-hydroxy-2-oxoglutarate aldolase/2-dehydro-3-deoxy-phosphogluconate aldolase [Chitinophagaceae bacterium]|jgi:2-dehydro-3-deoxyphosphogluconate aldolase / (4S)-4-hydroxy-2-oxoglutarate aldolase|nr:bifunctional 4-hydroxy-2-oxoglutarate aldolase/2-dehydro-3-deoxy-phosphogluconate aldolase [Chitinophagaceae bacterium]